MKTNKDCKIVQDLLPNYIENLTSNITNEFIEKHILNCKECENILKDMKGDIKLEKINLAKKQNSLKKVKRKIKALIIISFCLALLLSYIIFNFFSNYRIYINENNELSIERYSFKTHSSIMQKYIIIKSKNVEPSTKDGFSYKTTIIALNDDDICINARIKLEGLTEEYLNYICDRINSQKNNIESEAKIEDNSLYYTYNYYNGKNIDEILNSYEENAIIEIEKY